MAGTCDTRDKLYVMGSWSSYYIQAIQDWRENLKEQTIHKVYNGHQVSFMELPPKEKSTLEEIVLKTSKNTITLKISTFDLYIVGYKNKNNEWFEFKPKKKESGRKNADKEKKAEQTDHKLIPGSTFLDYSGSYDDLQWNAKKRRHEIRFSEEELQVAINNLGDNYGEKHDYEKKRAKALLVIVIMIPEALRFQRILTLVENEPEESNGKLWIEGLTTDWQLLSKRIKKASKHSYCKFDTYTIENSVAIKIETFEEACKHVRLVKYEDEADHV